MFHSITSLRLAVLFCRQVYADGEKVESGAWSDNPFLVEPGGIAILGQDQVCRRLNKIVGKALRRKVESVK